MRAVLALGRLLGKNLLAAVLRGTISHAHSALDVDDIIGVKMITVVQVNARAHRRLKRAGAWIGLEFCPVQFPVAADTVERGVDVKTVLPYVGRVEAF